MDCFFLRHLKHLKKATLSIRTCYLKEEVFKLASWSNQYTCVLTCFSQPLQLESGPCPFAESRDRAIWFELMSSNHFTNTNCFKISSPYLPMSWWWVEEGHGEGRRREGVGPAMVLGVWGKEAFLPKGRRWEFTSFFQTLLLSFYWQSGPQWALEPAGGNL